MSAADRRRSWRGARAAAGAQRGLVLLVALIVLALMSLAGIGVMRAADTGNVIAGNFSFQQAAVQASDRGLNDAMNALAVLAADGGGNADIANRYFAVAALPANLDARGVPAAIDWDAVSCTDPAGVAVGDCGADTGGYRVQYVIERMCSANPDLSNADAEIALDDIRAKCEYEPGANALALVSIALRYRVLIRVRGPRGTDGWFEAMVSGPAST